MGKPCNNNAIKRGQRYQKKDTGAIFVIIGKVGSRWRGLNEKRKTKRAVHLIEEHDLHKFWTLL